LQARHDQRSDAEAFEVCAQVNGFGWCRWLHVLFLLFRKTD
jgi:hypothetical protein